MITLPSVLFAESTRNIVPIWLAYSLLALDFSSRHLTNSGMLIKVQDPRIQHSHCLQTVTLWLQGTVISQQGISYQKMTFFLLVYFYFHTSVSALHRCPLARLQFHLNHIKLVSVLHTCMLQMIISHKMQDMHLTVKMHRLHLKLYIEHFKPTLQVLYWNGFTYTFWWRPGCLSY